MIHRPPFRRSRGFSIVEIMVGLFVGMLALVAVMAVYTGFEGQKRSTTSGSDAQSNGALGLYTLERDARQAGMGFSNIAALGCKVRAYNKNRTPDTFSFAALAPIVINPKDASGTLIFPAGDANTDVIQITFGDSTGLTTGVSFTQPAPGSANYKVNTSRAGFTVGELVIAAQPGSGLDCSLAQVTELPASGPGLCSSAGAGGTDVVVHNSGMYKDPKSSPPCSTTPSVWNKPSGLGVDYGTGILFDLGAMPTSVVYAVRNGNLTACNYLTTGCEDPAKANDPTVWVPIYTNIVSLRAQYGRDTASPMDGSADTFDQTTPTTACDWARVSAVRIAMVARSIQYEKGEVTTAAPKWAGETDPTPSSAALLTIDLSGFADWKHYRYKTFESVVPLRNIIWMDKSSC